MSKEICILNGTKWILGDESTEEMNWEDANKWCKSIGQDLPSREVLLMAFLNPEIRSNFAISLYWSSSEVDSFSAWYQCFDDGSQNSNFDKYLPLSVRAVRAISAEASEQTEQEPVGIVRTIGGYPDDSDHIAEWTCSFKYLKDEDRLYLAPSKREPLGERIEVPSGTTDYVFGFCDGVLYAEKKHGIGE